VVFQKVVASMMMVDDRVVKVIVDKNKLTKMFILTRPAFFTIEHRRMKSVCYYATVAQFDVLYLDM
jgi:hypothetical protein